MVLLVGPRQAGKSTLARVAAGDEPASVFDLENPSHAARLSDPMLARTMLLLVNVWLGFPYMMVLCAGLIQSIPADLYEASAVEGAGAWTNFRRITLPLIVRPLTPLLIAAFAFNFNNFVLISLLTGGLPDFLNTSVPAGSVTVLPAGIWTALQSRVRVTDWTEFMTGPL